MSTTQKPDDNALWERVKSRPGELGADRAAALAHATKLGRASVVRSRDEAATFLAGVGDTQARELLLVMLLIEGNYGLTERLVTVLSAQSEALDAAKALKVAEAYEARAAAFAFRRVARGVCERLGVAEQQVRAELADAEAILFLGRVAAADRELQATRASAASGTGHATLSRVPPGAGAPRPHLSGGLAAALLVALVMAGAWVALAPKLSELAEAQSERTSTVTPQALASASAPASFTHAKVTWSGVIENAVALTRTLYIKTGDGAQVVAVYDDILPDVRTGEAVKFSGKVTGRSRFGPIHLRGLTVERVRP